jgi:hypothetical protein
MISFGLRINYPRKTKGSKNWKTNYLSTNITAHDYAKKQMDRVKELEEALIELNFWCDSMNFKPDAYYNAKKVLRHTNLPQP